MHVAGEHDDGAVRAEPLEERLHRRLVAVPTLDVAPLRTGERPARRAGARLLSAVEGRREVLDERGQRLDDVVDEGRPEDRDRDHRDEQLAIALQRTLGKLRVQRGSQQVGRRRALAAERASRPRVDCDDPVLRAVKRVVEDRLVVGAAGGVRIGEPEQLVEDLEVAGRRGSGADQRVVDAPSAAIRCS